MTVEMIKKAVNESRQRLAPEIMILDVHLFGSYAAGTEHEESDVDLCVITRDSSSRNSEISLQIRKQLQPEIGLPMDILVYSESAFRDRVSLVSTFESGMDQSGICI